MQNPSQIKGLYQAFLDENLFDESPKNLYAPANYMLQLGGKRLRPHLVLLGYSFFDDSIEKALPIAHAVEVFHNFTLVHDDIMDEAPLRRGQKTIHEKYDVNTAILTGDVMLIKAYTLLQKGACATTLPRLLQTFNAVATEVCEGQQYDVDFEMQQDVRISDYLKMIALKTAALLGGALQLGAIAAKANEDDSRYLADFGRNMGIAFQLQDDLLDTFGNPEKFGKQPGGDILKNKKTFLYLKTLELANDADTAALKSWYADTSANERQKIESVTTLMRKYHIKELTGKIQESFIYKAHTALKRTSLHENQQSFLKSWTEKLVVRDI